MNNETKINHNSGTERSRHNMTITKPLFAGEYVLNRLHFLPDGNEEHVIAVRRRSTWKPFFNVRLAQLSCTHSAERRLDNYIIQLPVTTATTSSLRVSEERWIIVISSYKLVKILSVCVLMITRVVQIVTAAHRDHFAKFCGQCATYAAEKLSRILTLLFITAYDQLKRAICGSVTEGSHWVYC